ncbi:MAG TPA: hypothetical protein VGU71_08110 [Candidatus Dormibacteraeota bacterium]|nr:hypothetical protein [Candidatus Dormibacteraeota bacterium]
MGTALVSVITTSTAMAVLKPASMEMLWPNQNFTNSRSGALEFGALGASVTALE